MTLYKIIKLQINNYKHLSNAFLLTNQERFLAITMYIVTVSMTLLRIGGFSLILGNKTSLVLARKIKNYKLLLVKGFVFTFASLTISSSQDILSRVRDSREGSFIVITCCF